MQVIWQKAIAIFRKMAHSSSRVHADIQASCGFRARAAFSSNLGNQMQNLSPRHVKTEESVRLGVVSGWYSTKVSGTFVTGPHDTEADCLRKIAEINPLPPKQKKR